MKYYINPYTSTCHKTNPRFYIYLVDLLYIHFLFVVQFQAVCNKNLHRNTFCDNTKYYRISTNKILYSFFPLSSWKTLKASVF